MLESFDEVLLIEDVCNILHMSRNSLYVLLRSGELKGFQSGRTWKIPKAAVEEYIKQKSGLV